MSDEMMTEEPTVEEPQATEWEQRFKDLEAKANAEKSGLMKRNTTLEKALSEKEKEGMSVDERIKAIEQREAKANMRAESVEAFAKAGHKDEWRQLFSISDPVAQAETLVTMLSDFKREVTQSLAAEFGRNPESTLDPSKREYDMADLKGMTPAAINKLFAEGRVKGA